MDNILLTIVLSPLLAAIIAGLAGKQIGRKGAHTVTILGVAISCALSLYVLKAQLIDGMPVYNETVYQWMSVGGINMEVGFLVDRLTALMMSVVTFVSLMVHIYTIGYMHDDPGYQRFFSYISLFTFSMLMLVMSNNFLQLFFGWEAVGVVSYLLIGFWYTRPTAIFANLKAFLVNRVGDFGFILGIAAIVLYTGSLDYFDAFVAGADIAGATINIVGDSQWSLLTVACIGLFVGAMGKSAQVPLHVWLPDSMEGPTPISALIHAATMVTAGVFMVARMSPLFEFSETALTFVLVIGATTALFTGFLGLVQNDIKRVVAYSTLSQLGYMTVALGASAYAAGIFHLMTHAFFKALLFLAAGSVIIALHHEQDMRKMGGLKKYMPITYWTSLAGSLALIGFPGTAGFFSKDALIEAVGHSGIAGSGYAYYCVLAGVLITALYSFRMFFLVFHGKERIDEDARHHLHESPWVVTLPLVMLAIPSLIIGWPTIGPLLFGDFFGDAIYVLPVHDVLGQLGADYHGPVAFLQHGLQSPVLYLALAGVVIAWYLYLRNPLAAQAIKDRFAVIHRLLDNKYYLDNFNEQVIARASRLIGMGLWRGGDGALIDGVLVDGTANLIGRIAGIVRRVQTGYLYHYAFAMVIGLCVLVGWLIW
ncbi:MAG: NADH-quinone oxidoreductase subunit L [Chromatiales bacterium]|nr:NADH-quinone oxidoreductase subunit L [Chromatiales bacterium]MDP6149700.1 NADH-quinone oxidoreductase subunit L [Gammaproteobacteria bacterium]MDP7271882.1 NADH-quinone oxidoreductase subunit L [Gammaproteobacteria bacterium]HJP04082.1 NADH-quinone oxidoreductase subunit L [Gammaproteobacteria bacterium]